MHVMRCDAYDALALLSLRGSHVYMNRSSHTSRQGSVSVISGRGQNMDNSQGMTRDGLR